MAFLFFNFSFNLNFPDFQLIVSYHAASPFSSKFYIQIHHFTSVLEALTLILHRNLIAMVQQLSSMLFK